MALDLGSGEIIAIITSMVALVAAIGTAIVNIVVAVRTGSKLEKIETHVNSTATAAVAKIEALQNELRAVREEVTGGEKRAALLAQASATRRALEITSGNNMPGVTAAPQPPQPTVVLDQPIAVTVLPTEVPPDGTDK